MGKYITALMQKYHNVFGNLKLLLLILVPNCLKMAFSSKPQVAVTDHKTKTSLVSNKLLPPSPSFRSYLQHWKICIIISFLFSFSGFHSQHNEKIEQAFSHKRVSNVLREKQKRTYVEAGRNHIKYAHMMRAYLILCKTRHFQVLQTLQ